MALSGLLTPDIDPQQESARRKVALALLMQGSSGEPVTAWTQGLARVAQGALGGYELGQEEAQKKAEEASVNATLQNAIRAASGGGYQADNTPEAPAPQPSRVVAALAGQPATRSDATGSMFGGMPGWAPDERPIEMGAAPAAPVQTAQAAPVQQPPAAGTVAPRVTPALSPQEAAGLSTLAADKRFRPQVINRLLEATKPKDQWIEVSRPDGTKYFRNTVTGEPKFEPPGMNVQQQANTATETTYAKGKAEDALALERSADKTLQQRQQIDVFKSLVTDFKTGKLAPAQMTLGAWADALGIDPKKLGLPPNAAVNGQLIESLSNEMTLGMIGGKGGEGGSMPANNFSDADRKFLQNTVPGLSRMQGGNLILADIKARALDRHLEKISMWDDYRAAGKSYENFERDWRNKIRSEPSLFADIPDRIRQLSAAPAEPAVSAPAAPPSGGGWKIERIP